MHPTAAYNTSAPGAYPAQASYAPPPPGPPPGTTPGTQPAWNTPAAAAYPHATPPASNNTGYPTAINAAWNASSSTPNPTASGTPLSGTAPAGGGWTASATTAAWNASSSSAAPAQPPPPTSAPPGGESAGGQMSPDDGERRRGGDGPLKTSVGKLVAKQLTKERSSTFLASKEEFKEVARTLVHQLLPGSMHKRALSSKYSGSGEIDSQATSIIKAHVHARLKELKANMAKRAGNSEDVEMDMETTPT
ncbi:hypothetical protein T484DRAFT_1982244 [Baffinella frigidus]|nr:hypothetical protein T484DRAFT_1982244 [Cryptophyta sp. CCMP2293]